MHVVYVKTVTAVSPFLVFNSKPQTSLSKIYLLGPPLKFPLVTTARQASVLVSLPAGSVARIV